MRLGTVFAAAALLAGAAARAAGEAPGAPAEAPATAAVPAASAPAAAPAPVPASPAAPAAPEWRRAYQATVGVGYYERIHAGVAWQPSPRSALGAFAGSNLSLGDASTWDVGLSYAHALRRVAGRFELGWDGKAMYWQQESPDYAWKMMWVEGTPVPRLARPIVLMHRGGGLSDPALRQNTYPAIQFGATLYDGAEMDLQLSADGVVWLGHDNEVYDCAEREIGCFQNLREGELDAVAYCDTATATPCVEGSSPTCAQRYLRLADAFERLSADPPMRPKYFALDVKDQLCGSTGLPESRDMADALHGLVVAYQMDWRLFVESDQRTFMDEFRANGAPTYLFVEGYGKADPIIADADRVGATGVSYRYYNEPYDPAFTQGLRDVGLRVMVWAVPDPYDQVGDIAPVWAMNPDIIATDRADFYDHVPAPQPF